MICTLSTLFNTLKHYAAAQVLNSQILKSILIVIAGCYSTQTTGHEFWIEPKNYQLEKDELISASLKNGENFSGTHFSYLPQKFQQFEIFDQSNRRGLKSRLGDMPAVNEQPEKEGLHVLSYVSNHNIINYQKFENFSAFAIKQDLAWILDAHKAKQLPLDNITEIYTRYAKSLIASGTATGEDKNLGLTLELVALTNPYQREHHQDVVQYQLLYNQVPLPDTRIDLFYKPANKAVSVTYHRTNDQGIITFSADKPGGYLLSAVVAKEPLAKQMISTGALWETLWTSSTFGVNGP